MPETLADKWILAKLNRAVADISKSLSDYRFAEALEQVYSLLWDDFADWYIEASKVSPNPSVLVHGLETILKLTHPFAPFVTEAIWQKMAWHKQDLIISAWPEAVDDSHINSDFVRFESVKAVIEEVRATSAEMNLSGPTLKTESDLILGNTELVKRLARLSAIESGKGSGLLVAAGENESWLEIDPDKLKAYLGELKTKQADQKSYIAKLEGQLGNKTYVESAPATIVQDTRDRLKQAQVVLSKLDEQIRKLA
jgi:valyl-tRNA synthetase